MPPERLPTLLEVDPLPDAIGFLVRSLAMRGQRYRLRRLGSGGMLDLHLDGWFEPVAGGHAWAPPGPARFRGPFSRVLAGAASPRLLCVRGAPLDPALLKIFAPDIVIADEATMPRSYRIIRQSDAMPLAVAVASDAAEAQWFDLWAAQEALVAMRRALPRLALPADALLVWDGAGGVAYDGWSPALRVGADRPVRLMLPAIGCRGMRIALELEGDWTGLLRASLDGAPLDLDGAGAVWTGQSRTIDARHAMLALHIDPQSDPEAAGAGAMLRRIDLAAA